METQEERERIGRCEVAIVAQDVRQFEKEAGEQ